MLMLSGLRGLGDAQSDCDANLNTYWDEDYASPTYNTCQPVSVGNQAAIDACNANPAMIWDFNSGQCMISPSTSGNPAAITSPAAKPNSQGATAVPWWQSLVTGVTAGATSALIPKPGSPGVMIPAPQPWYTTPTGMGAIVVAVLLGAYIITKK